MNDEARYWGLVAKSPDGCGCWQWTNGLNGGYGRIVFNGRRSLAHRVAYELVVGPIPEGLTLDHLCRNRGCVNPTHLEPVTGAENTRRGQVAGNTWCRGEGQGGAKLTTAQVLEIRRAHAAGEGGWRALGKKYGVSHRQIGNIVNRKKWRHI